MDFAVLGHRWMRAKIIRVREDGTADVKYIDGSTWARMYNNLKLVSAFHSHVKQGHVAIGDHVEVCVISLFRIVCVA